MSSMPFKGIKAFANGTNEEKKSTNERTHWNKKFEGTTHAKSRQKSNDEEMRAGRCSAGVILYCTVGEML